MGIDAEILVRKVPAEVVTDEWLKQTSWNLCEAIGAKNFFIEDGLVPAEYEKVNRAWHAAFDAHPLYERWKTSHDRERREIHQQIWADVGQSSKCRRLAIDRTLSRYREEGDPPEGSEYHQDGDTIVAENGECLLRLSLWGRYYGIGYERGDILTYCAIAEWLEVNIPGCEVWYGGDSSGAAAEPFGEVERMRLRRHLYSKRGRDYFRHHFGDSKSKPSACSLCPGGRYCGTQYGSGHLYSAFICAGCGKNVESRDCGQTWSEAKKD